MTVFTQFFRNSYTLNRLWQISSTVWTKPTPVSWGGGVTGGQKGWMGLAGRPRAARLLHAGRKTRPLRRERDRESRRKKDRKWGLRVTLRDRTVLKKTTKKRNICHLLASRGKKSSTGQVHQGYMTRTQRGHLSFQWPGLFLDVLPALITTSAAHISKRMLISERSELKAQVGTVLAQQAGHMSRACNTGSDLAYEHTNILLPFPYSSLLYAICSTFHPQFLAMTVQSISERSFA